MVQKKRRITVGKQHLFGLIAAVGIISALWCQSFVSLADSNATVTVDSANIREKADASSEVIGSAARGSTVSIKSEVQDSSGTLWYEVYVDANTTGYIRSDLVEKKDGDGGASQSTSSNNQSASGASIEPETILDAQYAIVSTETAMVRTAPSTNEAVVDRLNRDAQVIVSGETQGNDGKKWYYVTFTGTGGADRSGFIRSDLLSLGDMVPVPEEEEPEQQEPEPEPEVPVNDDYKLTCEQNLDGSSEWYLYDYTDGGNKYRLSQLMEVTRARSENDAADAKTLVRQRVAIVILVILVVILIVVGVIMALKLRDVYYEDYEDEDEEEEEEEEVPAQRKRRTEEEEVPTQRRRRAEGEETSDKRKRRTEEDDTSARRKRRVEGEGSEAERPVRRRTARDDRESSVREVEYREDEAGSAPVKTAPKRKPKNFLLDDDEFEFEFLNMDDKD